MLIGTPSKMLLMATTAFLAVMMGGCSGTTSYRTEDPWERKFREEHNERIRAAETLGKIAHESFEAGDFETARAAFRTIIIKYYGTLKENGRRPVLMMLAESCFKTGHYDAAIADYTRAIEIRADATAHGWRAKAHAQLDQFDEAIADYTAALSLALSDKDRIKLRVHLALVRFEAGDADGALADITEALKIETSSVLYTERGKLHFRMKDFASADADLKQALALAKGDRQTVAQLREHALLRYEAGDRSGAFADLDRALAIEPSSALYTLRGRLHLEDGRPDATRADFDRALAMTPSAEERTQLRVQHARERLAARDIAGAIDELDRGIAVEPNAALHRARGLLMFQARRPAEALAAFDRALALAPPAEMQADLLHERALVRHALGDATKALADLDAGLAVRPSIRSYAARGKLLFEQGRYAEACISYDRAFDLSPSRQQRGELSRLSQTARAAGDKEFGVLGFIYERDILRAPNFDSYYNRGKHRLKSEDHQGAQADFDQALELATEDSQRLDAHHQRALAREGLDDLDGALADLDTAIAIEPSSELHNTRGGLLLKAGAPGEALVAFNQALALSPNDKERDALRRKQVQVRYEAGDVQGAFGDLDAMIAAQPSALLHKIRAELHIRQGDHAAAIRDFTRSIELARTWDNSKFAATWEADVCTKRALSKYALADAAGAREDLDQSIALSPGIHRALAHGKIYVTHGDLDRAIASYTMALDDATDEEWRLKVRLSRAMIHHLRRDREAAMADYDLVFSQLSEATDSTRSKATTLIEGLKQAGLYRGDGSSYQPELRTALATCVGSPDCQLPLVELIIR